MNNDYLHHISYVCWKKIHLLPMLLENYGFINLDNSTKQWMKVLHNLRVIRTPLCADRWPVKNNLLARRSIFYTDAFGNYVGNFNNIIFVDCHILSINVFAIWLFLLIAFLLTRSIIFSNVILTYIMEVTLTWYTKLIHVMLLITLPT